MNEVSKYKYTTNFIVFTQNDEFKWAICDFISSDYAGDNAEDIDNKILALRDKNGAISKEQLDLLIKEYWKHLPEDARKTHDYDQTIRATSDDDNGFTTLSDFAGGEVEALHLLHENGFEVIDPDISQQECAP